MGLYMPNIIEPNTKFTPRINVSLEPQIDWAHASVILGRDRQNVTKLGLKASMNLGVICEHQTAGASLFGYKVLFDYKFPHIIFICGKRGSGKSYTLGVIVEELGRSNSGIGTIVIDPLGTFWTMKNKNDSKKVAGILSRYGLYPQSFDNIQVLTPIGFYNEMKDSVDGAFSIAISDLSVDDWCLVFDIERFKTQGLLIGDALDKINNGYYAQVGKISKKIPAKRKGYTIGDIIFCIQNDVSINSAEEGYAVGTRRSVIARFRAAAKWGIFSIKGTPLNEISRRNKISILDVSHSKLGSSRRALLVGILARKVLEARIEASRNEEAIEMGIKVAAKDSIPITWLIIDEAHLLLPSSGKTAASESLIEYAKLGRKPGCGLVLATQRPAATNDDILSQVDTIIGHNLALKDDISALRRRIPSKIPSEFNNSDFIRSIPVGTCLLADQKTQQRTMLVQIRPRLTHHSGKAAMPKSDEEKELSEIAVINKELSFEEIPGLDSDSEISISHKGDLVQEDIMGTSMDITDYEEIGEVGLGVSTDVEIEQKDEYNVGTNIKAGSGRKTQLPAEMVEEKASEKGLLGKEKIDGFDNINIDRSGAYILVGKDPDFGLNILHKFSQKTSGQYLSITRTHPDKLNQNLLPENIKKIWLSKSEEKDTVAPGNITKIAHVINEFMKENENSVILLDGVEYLINNNDFPRTLKFVEMIHEKIVLSKGILFIPINPAAISKNNLNLLENEVSNKITDSELESFKQDIIGSAESIEMKEMEKEKKDVNGEPDSSEEKGKRAGEITKKQPQEVRGATKGELKSLCKKLGLDSSGSVEDLKKRLLEFEETESGSKMDLSSQTDMDRSAQKGMVKGEVKGEFKGKTKEGGKGGVKSVTKLQQITEGERNLLMMISEERKTLDSLLAERQKLQEEIVKLRDAEQKQKLQLERQKILEEREILKREKREIESEKKRLGKEKQLAEKQIEIVKKRKASEEDKIRKKIKGKERDIKDIEDLLPPKFKRKEKMPKKQSLKTPKELKIRDQAKSSKLKFEQISKKVPKHSKNKLKPGIENDIDKKIQLVIKSRIRNDAVEELAIKQLKTSLLGKPLEVIKNINQIYLPLRRIYIKAMRGTIFAKEHDGVFYWDTVTGEIITDVGNVLKRSKGLSMLMSLTPTQARVLSALDTWGNNDIVDLQNEIHIPPSQIKRTLTELRKKSLITAEQYSDKKLYNFKRLVELKVPNKFDRIKVEMHQITKGNVNNNVLPSQFKLSDLEKLLNTIVPGTRIISSEEVYYPYFRLEIIGKTGPRTVILDSITGSQDKTLTDYLHFKSMD
jgi:hypothetical protein